MQAQAIQEWDDGFMPPDVVTAPRTRRVLVAEDDPDMRRLLAAVLRKDGYVVVETRDGTEIIDRLESSMSDERCESFGAIISDINMPGLTGLDVLAAMRCANWDTPVILITAYGDDAARVEAEGLGAAAFLEKPVNPEELRTVVRRALLLAPDL